MSCDDDRRSPIEEGSKLANSKSALKRVRVAERNRLHNRPYRSAARTMVKKAEFAIQDLKTQDVELAEAQEAVTKAIAMLDRAQGKGIVHRNNAARRKSRLMAKFNAATSASA
jgi:small subunit ribosomal protein S20